MPVVCPIRSRGRPTAYVPFSRPSSLLRDVRGFLSAWDEQLQASGGGRESRMQTPKRVSITDSHLHTSDAALCDTATISLTREFRSSRSECPITSGSPLHGRVVCLSPLSPAHPPPCCRSMRRSSSSSSRSAPSRCSPTATYPSQRAHRGRSMRRGARPTRVRC